MCLRRLRHWTVRPGRVHRAQRPASLTDAIICGSKEFMEVSLNVAGGEGSEIVTVFGFGI